MAALIPSGEMKEGQLLIGSVHFKTWLHSPSQLGESTSPEMSHAGNLFANSIAVILSVVAIPKLISFSGSSMLLLERDPIITLRFANLLLLAAALEFFVVIICAFRLLIEKLMEITFLSSIIIAYRVGLVWVGWTKPCNCLGNMGDALPISPESTDNFMKFLLGFMFSGGVLFILMNLNSRSQKA